MKFPPGEQHPKSPIVWRKILRIVLRHQYIGVTRLSPASLHHMVSDADVRKMPDA